MISRLRFNRLIGITTQNHRTLSLSSHLNIKQIEEVKEGDNIVISGKILESERAPVLLKNKSDYCCPICATGLNIKHTDILIVSQFVRSDGCMLPRRVTGLCRVQQQRMSHLVTMAQKAGLMPNLNPANSNKDPKKRFAWKKFNKYFDEKTIKTKG